jgi:uncharacterized membrane protein
MTSSKSTLSFAAAAAVMALANLASTPALAKDTKGDTLVHCYGVNSCKGTSDCKTMKHECKGQNTCKGHGFKELTTDACKTQGGSTTEPKG